MASPAKFHWKVFVSFYVVFSLAVLALSGIVLYVAPPGRIANWSVWRLALLSKAQWQAMHTIVATLFLVAAGFHIYFNWKVLVAYLRSKLSDGLRMKRELLTATAAAALILTGTLVEVPPFSSVMAFGEGVKNSWSSRATEPPVPHAELLTIEKLAETVKIPVDAAMANLARHGVPADSAQVTVQQLATRHGLTPQQIYQHVQGENATPAVNPASGGGWGRLNVQQACERYSVPVDVGLQRLTAAGISATGTTMLKDLATAQGSSPSDIANLIAGK
jgi:hypothetical protein